MHLLTGLAVCDVCERTVRGASRRYKGEKRQTYACPNAHVSRPVPFVDRIVSERVCAVLSRPDVVEALSAPTDDDLGSLRAAQDLLKQRLDGAAQAYATGAISLDQLTTISADIGKQVEANGRRLAQTTKGSPLTALPDVGDIEQWWGALGVELKREVVKGLFEVRIERTKKGYVPRPENVVTNPVGAAERAG